MDIAKIIAKNLSEWMASTPGLDTLQKLEAKSGVGFGTVRRAKERRRKHYRREARADRDRLRAQPGRVADAQGDRKPPGRHRSQPFRAAPTRPPPSFGPGTRRGRPGPKHRDAALGRQHPGANPADPLLQRHQWPSGHWHPAHRQRQSPQGKRRLNSRSWSNPRNSSHAHRLGLNEETTRDP